MRRGSPEYTHNVADDNRRGVLLQVARRDDVVHPQRELGELEREKHPQDNLEPMQRSGRRGHSERGRHSGRGITRTRTLTLSRPALGVSRCVAGDAHRGR